MIELRAGAATDVGQVRTVNEDQLLVDDNSLFAVADGMGGAAAGEVASAVAIETLKVAFNQAADRTSDALIHAAEVANRAVWDQAEANPEMRGMGTTLVALALVDGPKLAVVNVGDSRLYVLRDGDFHQVTYDHNLVAEMVAEGRISKEEAEFHPRRNIMTRALGVDPDVPVDLFEVEDLAPGDRYLLCSDGLPREVTDDQIASLLRRLGDPGEAAKELVEEANRKGGHDNITVVVVDVVTARDGARVEAEPPTVAVPTARPDPAPKVKRDPRPRLVTFRVILFFAVLLVILGGAAAAVGWYARSGYFVGLKGPDLVIYQGRPGGVLWFSPTLATQTGVTTSAIEARHIPELQSGQEESSLADAQHYVSSLVLEKVEAEQALRPPVISPTRPKSTTTTRPKPATTTPTTTPTTRA